MKPLRYALIAALLALCSIASRAADAPSIPLTAGTVYTNAAAYARGDEEHIATLSQLDDQTATYNIDSHTTDGGIRANWTRKVRRQDLLTSHRLNLVYQSGDPDGFAGATFMQLSAAALTELQTRGETALVLGDFADYQGMSSVSMFSAALSGRKYFRGTLKRVGTGVIPIAVLVNGARQTLPTIASAGHFTVGAEAVDVKFWWLADPQNALLLRSDHGQTVRIDFPQPAAETSLAQSLRNGDCRAKLSGIYFDTGSATLLAQSASALQTVAAMLKANAQWTLTIEGHTDNIGKPAYNLDLSQRRATAVQTALQTQYSIATQRLSAKGYGAERPVQANSTLEGRAANRRVELARQCS